MSSPDEGSSPIMVAVVDSGVNVPHPHLPAVAGGTAFDVEGRQHDDYTDRLGHGTAVAAGMLLEAELGERLGITEGGTRAQIASSLSRLGLSLDSVPSVDLEAAMGFLASDKKARSGRPRYVLLRRLGEVEDEEAWSREIPDSLVRDVLAEIA